MVGAPPPGSPGARAWLPLDWIVAVYTAWIAALIAVRFPAIEGGGPLLVYHGAILAALALAPRRGAAWEQARPGEPPLLCWARDLVRLVRYSYPLLLVIFFFEEVQSTVFAFSREYWFEPYLYAADRAVFGTLPALLMASWQRPWLDELMHFFYSSYYYILGGGAGATWFIGYYRRWGGHSPGPAHELAMTSVTASFLCAFVWYPFLPARGPWENPELMAGLPPFQGFAFQRLIETIIDGAAVSGACFPSGHAAGTWGMTFGLWPYHRRTAWAFAFFALGMSVACVYTRYHHAVDIVAGFACAVAGYEIARALVPPRNPYPPSAARIASVS